MTNRLQLDFSLQTLKERNDFIIDYLQSYQFQKRPLTEEELETCSNYILWGKDLEGKNGVQKKEFQIQTKNSTWNKKEIESLDALLETPTFNEALIVQPNQARTKITREVFSRTKALENAPEVMKPLFVALFQEIDETDLILNYYDLLHGKRKNPPRDELLNRFTIEEQERLKEKATHLNQYKYLKLRHQLVELRQQQFVLKDSYSSCIQIDSMLKVPTEDDKLVFGADMNVYPLGLKHQNSKVFLKFSELIPENFNEQDLEPIIKHYWNQQDNKTKLYFDFEDTEHVYNLLLNYCEFEEDVEIIENKPLETLKQLLNTLNFYIENAELTDCQKEILELKKKHIKNQDIIDIVNSKYGKNYTANYISTIFRQKIIKKINESATYHKDLVLNLPFQEEFKRCTICKTMLLKDSRNFVKKTRSKDGFTSRCKECDKKERQIKRSK